MCGSDETYEGRAVAQSGINGYITIMEKKKKLKYIILCMIVFFMAAFPLSADLSVSVAFLSIENLSANPRYDYLEGIVRGILLYDLTSVDDIDVVNRSDLESILKEQELRLSSIVGDNEKAVRVGRILGADYLLKGEYVFMGRDVLVTVTLLDVVNARTLTFSERGANENMLHALSEQIIFRLTGRELVLQSDQRNRSIISLQDESPGTIALHSNLVDAEIFLDNEFAGYSTGDVRVPFIIEDIIPGLHRLRIHLSNFGVVKEPEITFHDWEEDVEVKPGRKHVIRADARHFNSIIYDLMQLVREEVRLSEFDKDGPVNREHDVSFIDRESKKVTITLEIRASRKEDDVLIQAALYYDKEPHSFELISRKGERQKLEEEVGKIKLRLEIDKSRISYSIWRADIRQNMFH
jgi:TolB-like protein